MKNVLFIASFLITSLFSTLVKTSQRVNVARNKKAHQSSTSTFNNFYWKADFVLDGKGTFDINCKCCSITTNGRANPWLIVNLEKIYHIGRIDVLGRQDVDYQLRGFKLYTGERRIDAEAESNLVYTNAAVTKNEYLLANGRFVIPVGNLSMQFIRIYNEQINQMSICEIRVYEACEDFQFEPECRACHCQGSPCDKITGSCSSHCQPGWRGTACDIPCESGKFGTNCEEECHCLNPASCDKATGMCSDGYCMFGWKGNYCNISALVSEGKLVKMRGQFSDWNAENAVDGDTKTAASACWCCAATDYGDSPWFQIDLGRLYRIAYIIIYGRTDHDNWRQSFNGLNIYAKKYSQAMRDPIFSYDRTTYFLNITLDIPVITRYITLKQTGNKRIVICELQLLEGDCDDGQFGRLCDKSCHCLGETCNEETGVCPSGACLPGFRGITCSEECANGQFGNGCNQTCGHCFNSTACDKVQGNCSSCDPGYIGQLCTKSCSEGTYGLNCSSFCGNCQDDAVCDHVTGHCWHGCDPGYRGFLCNKSCGYGRYGMECNQNCGSCVSNQTCNITNGHCGDTGCVEGFIEPLCIARTEKLVDDENSSQTLGVAVGIPVALAFVALAVLVVTVVILRKRRQNVADKEADVFDADNTNDKEKDDIPSIPDKDPEYGQRTVTFSAEALKEMEYYEFSPRKEDIKIHQIWDYIHNGMANGCIQFYDEFESFKKGIQFECKCARESQNKPKNRYKEIYAYDENRVCLKSTDPSEGDYINASYIDGYEKLAKFIASQGPTKEMVDDFWRMIWQQNCTDIVMLTNVFELGVQKCLQYWPMDDEPLSFGKIVVKLLKEEKFKDFVIRSLEISHNDEETRIIKQYHFTSWPDKTIPDTTWSLVNFWRTVREGATGAKCPIVVHCSAGIGRTGTFIALDNLYNQAVTEGSIRPAQMVETLRRQRTNMVQTKEQYVYLHEAVSEALLFGTHFVKTEQFEHVYGYLLEKQKDEAKTNLEIQFDLIELSLHDNASVVKSGALLSNTDDGIGKTNLPADESMENEAMYTNVGETLTSGQKDDTDNETNMQKVYIVNNLDEQTPLVKAVPTGSNMFEAFLDVIISSNVETIIQLQGNALGLTTDIKVGHFDIQSSNQTTFENWTRKEFLVADTKSETTLTRNIRQYEYCDWKNEENIPRNMLSFLGLLSDIQSQQPGNSSGQTILVADSGANRCGVMCVMLTELIRMSNEDTVNIVDSVKKIRHQDRGSMSSLEQYKFCHDAILSVAQQNDLYQNVFL